MVLIYHTAEAELSNVVLGTGSSSVVLFIDPRLRSRNLATPSAALRSWDSCPQLPASIARTS